MKPRFGKTQKDHESGAWANRFRNQEMRESWMNLPQGQRTNSNFPYEACNGKKNRFRVTGKGGASLILRGKKQ